MADLDYTSAAAELNLSERYLRRNIRRLPHRKYGREVRFTATDLDTIRELHASGAMAAAPVTPAPGEFPAIRPSRRARSTRTAEPLARSGR